MRDKISTFLDGLIVYDYILFGTLFCIFILLIIIGILKRDNLLASLLIFIFAFVIAIAGSTIGYTKMHQFLFKNEITLIEQKRLTYTKALVVYGKVKNVSKFNFSMCKISADVYKVSGNVIKDFLFQYNPFNEATIIEYDILKGQEVDFKVIIEPFTYSKDYNISLGASCR